MSICEKATPTYALSNITESSDNGDFTSEHDIGGSLDTVDEGLSATVLRET